MGKILSLIIPAYNAEPYINELLDCLASQITDEVEVLVVDDGSDKLFKTKYQWVNVTRQENKGVSHARNVGIESSTGEYLAFIDADDLVSDKYIETILKIIKTEKSDYIYLSWKTITDNPYVEVRIKSVDDKFPSYNTCVWNRVYKRTLIGDLRFNTNKSVGEDAEFILSIDEHGKKSFISDFMYFYREATPNSLSKQFNKGKLSTRRVIYYLPIVTKKMMFLEEEFKQLVKVAEIILMTNHNELPQLAKYAVITTPHKIHGTELRGYYTNLFIKVNIPVKTQVVIWTEKTFEIGGIETFNYNFCRHMSSFYDITVLYKIIDPKQRARLSKYVNVMAYNPAIQIQCDTLIVNRITDKDPKNVIYKQKVQMVHSCKWAKDLVTPTDNNYLVPVSEAVARSYPDFKKDYVTINNMTYPVQTDRALVLISATRTGTNEKGQKRMITLSNMLKEKNIPFVWFCFSDYPIKDADNICFLKPTLDIAPYIKMADYLVQLSDHEGFCYSMVEALELGTPVLTTPLEVLPELGFKDGETGYIIPFDMQFDVSKIFENQLKGQFKYKYNNKKRIKQWRKILGDSVVAEKIVIKEPVIKVKAIMRYSDISLNRVVEKGEILEVTTKRAYELMARKPQLVDLTEEYR